MPRLKLTGEALEKHKAEKQQKRDELAQKKREILARKFARIERRAKELFEREKKSQKADSRDLRSSLAQRFSAAAVANEIKVFEKDRTSEVKLLRDSKFNKKLILKTLHDYIGAVSSEYEGVIEVFNLTLGMIEDDIQFTKEDLINYNDPSRRAEIDERFLNTDYQTMEIMTNMIVETLDSPSGNGIVEQYVEVDAPNFNNVEKIRLPDGTLVFMSEEEDEDGTHKIYDISTLEYIGDVSQEPEETMENRVKRLTGEKIKRNLGIGGYETNQLPSAEEIKSTIASLFEEDPIKAELKSLFEEEDKVIVSAPKETPRTFKKGFGIRRLRKGFGIKRLPKPQGKIANAMVAKGIVRTFSSSEEDSDFDPEDDEDEEIDGFKALPEELQRKLDFALNTDRFTKITNLNLRLNGEEFETIILLNLGDDGENWEEHENPYFNFPLAFSDAGAIIGRYDITRKKLVNLADNAIGFSEKNKRVGIDSGEYDGGYDLDVILNSRELFDSSKLEDYFDNMTVFRGIDRLSEEPIYKEIVANYKLLEGIGGAASASGGGAKVKQEQQLKRVDEASILGVGREARVKGMMKYQEITNEDEIEANEAFFDRDKDNEDLMVYYDDISELFYASWDNNEIITNIELVGASDEKGKLYYDFKKEQQAEQLEEEEPFIEGAGAGAGAGSSAGGSNLGLDDPDLGKEKANEKLVDALESYQGNMDIIRTQLEYDEPDWRHMYIKTDGGRYLADTYKRMGKTQQKKAQNKVVVAIAALDALPTIGDFGAEGATADAIYEASRDYQDYYNSVYGRMPEEYDGEDRWFNEEYIDESIEWLRKRAEELRKIKINDLK